MKIKVAYISRSQHMKQWLWLLSDIGRWLLRANTGFPYITRWYRVDVCKHYWWMLPASCGRRC